MFLTRLLRPLRLHPTALLTKCKLTFITKASNDGMQLLDKLQRLADEAGDSPSQEGESEFVRNYVELTEQSFSQCVDKSKLDPQMLLMMLSTFEDARTIKELLPLLYPSVNFFQKHEMLLLMQKVLAFKPVTKPKIPHPKPLEGIESILVILSELYEADSLVEWIKGIPLYQGDSPYVLAMGYFAILEKMKPQTKSKNRALLVRCHEKISSILKDESYEEGMKAGIVCVAFQLNYGQAISLFFTADFDYSGIEAEKLCLLFTNFSKYHQKQLEKPQQLRDSSLQKASEKQLSQILRHITQLDFTDFMQAEIFIELWKAAGARKTVKGSVYTVLIDKLCRQALHPDFQGAFKQLNHKEMISILECLEKHKVSKEKVVQQILAFLSEGLLDMEKEELIRLLKCLVTFVRQCQEYLIGVRSVMEERRLEFSQNDAVRINEILKRVSVLFPLPFRAA